MPGRWAAPVLLAAGMAVTGLVGVQPAAAEAERMHLECENGLVVERSNGSSWWGVAPDGSRNSAVYTTRRLVIVDADGDLVHEQDYGQKSAGSSTTCEATHFDWRWTVELVRVR